MRLQSIDIEVLEHSRDTEIHLEGQRLAERCYLGPGLMGLKRLGKCAVHCGGIWLRRFLFRCNCRPMGSPWVVVHGPESQTTREKITGRGFRLCRLSYHLRADSLVVSTSNEAAHRRSEVYTLRSVLLLVDPLTRSH